MNKNAKLSMMARRRRKDGTFMEYMGMNPIQTDMVLYSHSKEQDRSKAGKEKTMKTFYFDNFDDFEESGVAGEYEVTAIVKKDHCNNLCADLMTECKSWKTAIRRFFKSLTDYPEFNG